MRVWTVQSVAAWRRLQRDGRLTGDGRRAWNEFRAAYRWMQAQMMRRGLLKPGRRPIWVWLTPKPDLRHGAHMPHGMKGCRLELEVSPDRVLPSHFQAWHCALNRGYLALTDREDRAFDAKCRRQTGKLNSRWEDLHAGLRAAMTRSWERMFDLDGLRCSSLWRSRRVHEQIQGTMAEILIADVVRSDVFTAR